MRSWGSVRRPRGEVGLIFAQMGLSGGVLDRSTFAVVAVVMATRYQPAFLFYPVHAFAAGFLLLAAGFAGPTQRREGLRAAASTAGLAWAGTAAAAAAAMALAGAGLPPPGKVPADAADLAATALLAPLGLEAAPGLFPAGWLLAAAAAGLALSAALRPAPALAWSGAAAAALAAVVAGGDGPQAPGPRLLAARLAFALAFVLAGAALRGAGDAARRLRAPALLAGGFVLVDALAVNGGGLGSRIEAGSLGASPPLALATTAAIALMGWSVAGYAAEVVPARSALLAVGRAWRAVLALHAAVLFAVDLGFVAAGLLAAGDLPDAARTFKLDRFWLLYLVPAVALPALAAWAAGRLRRRPAGESA